MHHRRAVLTSVNCGAGVVKLKLIIAKGNLVQFNLPVGLSAHRSVRNLALVGGVINTTEGGLSSVFLGISHAEGKHRFVNKTLVHKVVERRDDVSDSDGVVSETKNTIKSGYYCEKGVQRAKRGDLLAKGKGKTWLLGSFGEVHTSHGEVTHAEIIVRDVALHGTGTIVDLKVSSVGLVGGRGTGIVFGVEEARDGRALGAGNPEVTRSKRDKY